MDNFSLDFHTVVFIFFRCGFDYFYFFFPGLVLLDVNLIDFVHDVFFAIVGIEGGPSVSRLSKDGGTVLGTTISSGSFEAGFCMDLVDIEYIYIFGARRKRYQRGFIVVLIKLSI